MFRDTHHQHPQRPVFSRKIYWAYRGIGAIGDFQLRSYQTIEFRLRSRRIALASFNGNNLPQA